MTHISQLSDEELDQGLKQARDAWFTAYLESIKDDPEKILECLQLLEEHTARAEAEQAKTGEGGPQYTKD